jgi:hypothetical protein
MYLGLEGRTTIGDARLARFVAEIETRVSIDGGAGRNLL